jgi:Ca2+-transporting ATPase
MLQRYEPEPTPLQRRLAELGKVLISLCLGIVVLIFALQLLRGGDLLEIFMLSVGLAVAAVPKDCRPSSRLPWRWGFSGW